MLKDIQKDAETRMNKTLAATRDEMNRIRTGRASVALLDQVTVEYYGTPTPINQVATVAVEDPRTLSIQPWEKQMVETVEKAILESGLGLNPVSAGEIIRVPLPAMTEERRVELVKLVKRSGENGKVALRNIRRDALHSVRELLKAKELSEDQERDAEKALQDLTDNCVTTVDEIVLEKEKEVMAV